MLELPSDSCCCLFIFPCSRNSTQSLTVSVRGDTEIGMARLALSDSDKTARQWFAETTEALGCKVSYDAMGNQFAVRPGLHEGPPIFAGSHLDTQPSVGTMPQSAFHC